MAPGDDGQGRGTTRRDIFAWVGAFLVVGIIGFAAVAGWAVLQRGPTAALKVQCSGNLRQIFGISLSYSSKRGRGHFPQGLGATPAAHDSLNVLVSWDPEALNPKLFCCPVGRSQSAEPDPVTRRYALTADTLDYAWTRRGPLRNTVANQPLASDKHAGSDAFFRTGRDGHPGGINVLFTDGSVQWVATKDLPPDTGLPEGLTR